MSLEIVQHLLTQTIGLNPRTVSARSVDRAIRARMAANDDKTETTYVARLAGDRNEIDALIEEVVIPETWFFRDTEPFVFLSRFIRQEWAPRGNRPLKALSIPCSTGEEPYSIVMTCLDAGLAPHEFRVDAVDISRASIKKAGNGVYGRSSFRENDRGERRRYFQQDGSSWVLNDSIRKYVRFTKGNILNPGAMTLNSPYDIIFCRNLLIYLDKKSRKQATGNIDLLLAPQGIVFLGYAETRQHFFPQYQAENHPRCYAARKTEHGKNVSEIKKAGPAERNTSPSPAVLKSNHERKKQASKSLPPPDQKVNDSLTASPTPASLSVARQLADSGQLTAAETICQDILSRDVTEANAYALLGIINLARNDEEQAIRCFDRAVYLDPGHRDALTYLGLIMEKTGRSEQAALYQQRLLRLRDRESGHQ
jgi:chemotaxis protein methyltransferase WspC